MAEVERVELVAEKRLHKLLTGETKKSRLEASGVLVVNPTECYVVFDNTRKVARIDPSLKKTEDNRLIATDGPSEGYEGIAYDPTEKHFYLLIETIKDADGNYRSHVLECDLGFRRIRSSPLGFTFEDSNRGFEGLVHRRQDGKEFLWALCEGNLCRDAKKGGGRIQVFTRKENGGWRWCDEVRLPEQAEFEDYSALALSGNRAAVVSQRSRRLWLGEITESGRAFRGEGRTYAFPDERYCNVEGVSWLSENRLIAVSDRSKKKQQKACRDKAQSIHVLDIPEAR